MRLLSDRIQEFIDWLEEMTDFGDWDDEVKKGVHKKLITCMISDPIMEYCEDCGGHGTLLSEDGEIVESPCYTCNGTGKIKDKSNAANRPRNQG